MRSLRLPTLFLASIPLATSCGSPAEPGSETIEVPPLARQLLQETLVNASAAIDYNVRFSDALNPPHLAFSGWLVGRPEQFFAHVSLATTDEGAYDEYCTSDGAPPESSDFWLDHAVCSRLRIASATYHVDVYFTERPHRIPDDRHELRYPSEGDHPEGSVVYARNPRFDWQYEFRDGGGHTVRATIDASVRFEPNAGEDVIMDHSGTVSGTRDASRGVAGRVELDFPGLTECPVPLHAVVEDDGESVTGAITCGDAVLADITHPGDRFRFDWKDS